jgi:hypothetical protein
LGGSASSAAPLCILSPSIRHLGACAGRFPIRHFTAKIQSQGNGCQGNGKKRFQNDSDNHFLDISPAFSIRHRPSFGLFAAGRAGNFARFCGCFSRISTKSVDISPPGTGVLLAHFAHSRGKSAQAPLYELLTTKNGAFRVKASQAQSKPVKVKKGQAMLFWRTQIGPELSNPYQNGRDCESRQQQPGYPARATKKSEESAVALERRVALGFPTKITLQAGCKPALQLFCPAPCFPGAIRPIPTENEGQKLRSIKVHLYQ